MKIKNTKTSLIKNIEFFYAENERLGYNCKFPIVEDLSTLSVALLYEHLQEVMRIYYFKMDELEKLANAANSVSEIAIENLKKEFIDYANNFLINFLGEGWRINEDNIKKNRLEILCTYQGMGAIMFVEEHPEKNNYDIDGDYIDTTPEYKDYTWIVTAADNRISSSKEASNYFYSLAKIFAPDGEFDDMKLFYESFNNYTLDYQNIKDLINSIK